MLIPVKALESRSSNECSISCLLAILNYYHHPIDRKLIRNLIKFYTDDGPLLTDIASTAKVLGFEVDCLAFNLRLTSPSDQKLSAYQLTQKLMAESPAITNPWDQKILSSTLKCLEAGVRYLVRNPELSLIQDYLQTGIPLIASVSDCVWHSQQGNPMETHAVIITGFEENKIYFLDPNGWQKGEKSTEDFLFAFYQRKLTDAAAYLIAVKPKIV